MGFAKIIRQKIKRYLGILNFFKLVIALDSKRIPSRSSHKQRLVGLGRAMPVPNGKIRKQIKTETELECRLLKPTKLQIFKETKYVKNPVKKVIIKYI